MNMSLERIKPNDGVVVMKPKNLAISNAIDKANKTQKQLAHETGLNATHINAIVHGTKPNVETAIKIARALNATVEELWGEKEEN